MKIKYVIIGLLLLLTLASYTGYEYLRFHDGNLHLVFCNVGQGDAIFMRTPKGKTLLVDGGPDKKVLSCMQNHLPFWQRDLTAMLLTHPHADHLNGLIFVLERYSVKYFITENLSNKTDGFNQLKQDLEMKKIPQKYVGAGDSMTMDGMSLQVIGPSEEFLERTSPAGTIGESKEFGSVISYVTYGTFSVLLTGDSQIEGLSEALESAGNRKTTVFHVPHHGSRFGTSGAILATLEPQLAVFSVGKNTYGHPSPVVMQLLQEAKTPFLRTDQDGDIEIVSDGKKWWIAK